MQREQAAQRITVQKNREGARGELQENLNKYDGGGCITKSNGDDDDQHKRMKKKLCNFFSSFG